MNTSAEIPVMPQGSKICYIFVKKVEKLSTGTTEAASSQTSCSQSNFTTPNLSVAATATVSATSASAPAPAPNDRSMLKSSKQLKTATPQNPMSTLAGIPVLPKPKMPREDNDETLLSILDSSQLDTALDGQADVPLDMEDPFIAYDKGRVRAYDKDPFNTYGKDPFNDSDDLS